MKTLTLPPGRRPRTRQRGQALAEFALVLVPFMLLLLGLFDMGRGIYTYNAVSQAAREIARVTSVHAYDSCCDLGTSVEATAVKDDQKAQVPGLTDDQITIDCVDIADTVIADAICRPGDYIRVTVAVPFDPVTPLLGQLGPFTLSSVSRIQIP